MKVLLVTVAAIAVTVSTTVSAKTVSRPARIAPEKEYALSYAKNYFLAKNGYEKIVRVKFLATPEAKAIVPEAKLQWIASLADFGCKLTAKNQVSYVPFRLFIYGGDDGTLDSVKVAVEWLGKNSYGAESKANCFFQLKPDFTPYDPDSGL